ncbi:MAG: hypothetical protein ACRD47_02350, partial [Nitrososphaeraceae archaeon]
FYTIFTVLMSKHILVNLNLQQLSKDKCYDLLTLALLLKFSGYWNFDQYRCKSRYYSYDDYISAGIECGYSPICMTTSRVKYPPLLDNQK